MPKPRKMHFHRIIAVDISTKRTRRGNPETYTFTLDCGHKAMRFHNARTVINSVMLQIITNQVKKGKHVSEESFPRMHCHQCARGKPHTEEAVDMKKLVAELNETADKVKAALSTRTHGHASDS